MPADDRKTAYPRLIPDAVFELVSPSDDVREVGKKMDGYITNGALVAVMIDPATQMVVIWRSAGERVNHATPTIEIGPEMPEFVLDAEAVLRAAEPA